MSYPQFTGIPAALPGATTTESLPTATTDPALEFAVQAAGEQPVRESVLHQALRGGALPPPVWDHYFDGPPAGSFDAGVARVLGELYHLEFAHWVKANKYPIVGDFPDVLGPLQDEVKKSYGFGRFAVLLATGIRMAQEYGDSEDERQADAERDISKLAAVGFYAGWLMGQEHMETEIHSRSTKGTVQELVEVFRRKMDIGAVFDDALTSKGYWTAEQIDQAKCIVRREENPDETTPEGYWKDDTGHSACGHEHAGFRCTLGKGHDGDHVAEMDDQGPDQRWSDDAQAVVTGGGR